MEQDNLQQLFADSLADVALVVLDVEGKVLTWDAGAQAVLGYSEAEVVGRHFSFVYTEGDINAGKPLVSLAGALAQGRHEDIGLRRRKDGTEFHAESVLIPLFDPMKKLVAFGSRMREVDRVAPAAAVQVIAGVATSTLAGKKVLLVDDDEAVRGAAVGLLTSLGYQVVAAPGGAEALELLARTPDIDVLFTDVVMPGGMSGSELAEQARALRPDLKILFASGYFEGALVREGTIAASTQFLVKPYRKKELALKMDEVLKPAA
jgi:PAS domain S-box-containing protein